MGIESKALSIVSEGEKPKALEFDKTMKKDGEYLKADNLRETSQEHVLVNAKPIREELVQMAVKFLSHATVRSSPVLSRRSFLEKKGLTKEEIDEAFLRVPDPPINGAIGQSLTSSQDAQSKPFTNIQSQATVLATSPPSRFYGSQTFVVLGLLAASGAGAAILLKNFILPRLKSWIRKVVLEEHDGSAKKSKASLFEEVTAAAKKASTAAKASMEMLNSKNEERQYFEALKKHLERHVAEMRSMSNAIQKLEGTRGAAATSYKQPQKYVEYASRNGPNNTPRLGPASDSRDLTSFLASSMKVKANDVSKFDGSVRPSSTPAKTGPYVGQHPKSYMEIMSMIQRGEIPPGIKEINDSPPNPDQPLPNPGMAPRIKPWEVAQPFNNGTYAKELGSTSQFNGDKVLPLWQHKNVGRPESEPGNGMRTNIEWPVQSWVPPQPFSVAMPKAGDAVRLPLPED